LFLQRTIGNRATSLAIQREFEDQGEKAAPQPVLEEAASGAVNVEGVNAFGESDGMVGSGVAPHAMSNKGKTGSDLWEHAGGAGGVGNQSVGSAELTAPVYETRAATAKKPAKAWIKSGTGKVKVVRSYTGVSSGNNGVYKHGGGTTWVTGKASTRIDKHEKEHIKSSKALHDAHIKPVEKRVSSYRGLTGKNKDGADEAAATTALQTEIDWNTAVNDFATNDSAQNTPMGPVDLIDQAKPDFYYNFGAKEVKKVQYDHFVDTN